MAETYVIRMRDLPSRSLRRRVRTFLQGDEVRVENELGQRFSVELKKNKMVFRSNDKRTNLACGGEDKTYQWLYHLFQR